MVSIIPQYPHYVYRRSENASTQTATGSWTKNSPSWTFHSMGREETNGAGSKINTGDGRTLIFSSLIQLPVGTIRIDEETEVLILSEEKTAAELDTEAELEALRKSGVLIARGSCKKFDQGRLHCRMWI